MAEQTNEPSSVDEQSNDNTDHKSNKITAIANKVLTESGIKTVYHASIDVKLLFLQRFVRLFAYGGSTLVLASYLRALGNSETRIGLFMTLTLAGDVIISFVLALVADTMGRKAVLCLGSILMAGSGIAFGLVGEFWGLLAAAIFGVISPSGNEIGPFRAVEESTLAHLVPVGSRADIFAWYTLIGSAGTAAGMITCGWVSASLQKQGQSYISSCRVIFFLYALIGLIKFCLSLMLSAKVEAWSPTPAETNSETEPLLQQQIAPVFPAPPKKAKPSVLAAFSMGPEMRILFFKLVALFFLDNFASGLMPLSWLTYYFRITFSIPDSTLGSIFFVTSIISALSTLVAAGIARRIGNVRAMAFTHLPSAIMLALIPVPTTLGPALVLLIIRSCSQMMDVAPRTAFLAQALPGDRRTAMMGSLNVIKTIGQSIGPVITGHLASNGLFWVSFVAAGSLKACYDIGMLLTFAGRDSSRSKPTPTTEEEAEEPAEQGQERR